jgi:hypothetical protein
MALKSFFGIFLGTFFTTLALAATPYSPSTLLSHLPEDAKIRIKIDLELYEALYGDELIHYTAFENGESGVDTDINSFGATLNSQVILRTNTPNSLVRKTVSRAFYNAGVDFLKRGTYCLDRKESDFGSANTWMLGSSYDRLFFRNCETGQSAFAVYAIAGLGLRRSEGFHGMDIRQFDHQTGKAIEFFH